MDLDDVAHRLFEDAVAVDADPASAAPVLERHWSLLADAGLLGVQARDDLGATSAVLAVLAGSCLSTALLWLQHEGATTAVAGSPLADELGSGLRDGSIRAGLALAGLRPGPDQLRAARVGDGWSLTGQVPWVSGFGIVDQLQVAAAYADDVVFLLVPAASAGLVGEPQPLTAAAASATATVRFDQVGVVADRELRRVPVAEWAERQQWGVPLNGFLAVGVAERCARLAETSELDDALAEVRHRLLTGAPEEVPEARADASLLAVRAATGLVLATGSAAAVRGSHAERLVREAALLLVFAGRPRIKVSALERWARA